MDALTRSIEKYVPNYHLYIFDNSDKHPYHNDTENPDITIIDNTKGQIIDFDKWLAKYPNHTKSYGRVNGWGSAKHCYTIQKCMELIPDNFILMDSDILLKQDITPLFDERYIYVGSPIRQGDGSSIFRLDPVLCFINSKKCNQLGIRYFNDDYILGLMNTVRNPYADFYDTGTSFLMEANPYPHKDVDITEYAIHYASASWIDDFHRLHGDKPSPEQWLEMNKEYFQ